MTYARALIDAEFHDTPIRRCVVLPAKFATTFDPLTEADVLAVVETDTSAFSAMGSLVHVRRGFVRVVEVLPVVLGSDDEQEIAPCLIWWNDEGWMTYWDAEDARDGIFLPVSPGDVVLVTEAWCEAYSKPSSGCECEFPSPVTLIHRDGVLGEVET